MMEILPGCYIAVETDRLLARALTRAHLLIVAIIVVCLTDEMTWSAVLCFTMWSSGTSTYALSTCDRSCFSLTSAIVALSQTKSADGVDERVCVEVKKRRRERDDERGYKTSTVLGVERKELNTKGGERGQEDK